MNRSVINHIKGASQKGKKLLAILLDPDRSKIEEIPVIVERINQLKADFIFVGGSIVKNGLTDVFVEQLKTKYQASCCFISR